MRLRSMARSMAVRVAKGFTFFGRVYWEQLDQLRFGFHPLRSIPRHHRPLSPQP